MPPTILQQHHTVVLGPGASTTIAHSLTDGNRNLVPNFVYPDRDTPIQVTAATATDVTYTNTDAANAATAVFRVQFDHTIQQATPTAGNPQLNLYYQGGGAGGGAGGSSNCLIYRPGSGASGPVVFDTWADLMTQLGTLRAAANSDGCYTIAFDDSLTSPAPIPAGAYDMTGVTWTGRVPGQSVIGTPVVEPAEGATCTNLRRIEGNLWVDFAGVTAPVSDLGSDDTFTIRDNVLIICTGQAFFDCSNVAVNESCTFIIDEIVALGDGQVPVIFGALALPNENDATIRLSLGSEVEIRAEALETGQSFVFDVFFRNGSARVLPQTAASFDTVQTTTQERWETDDVNGNTIVNTTNEDFGKLYRCDPTAGPITINLPPSEIWNKGRPFTVKRLDTGSPNNVSIAPNGTDQIDSGGAGVAFVNSTPLSSNTFISDGNGGWDVI